MLPPRGQPGVRPGTSGAAARSAERIANGAKSLPRRPDRIPPGLCSPEMSESDGPAKKEGDGGSSDLSRDLTAATPPGSAPRPSSSISGTTLQHFEVFERIGAGGFGEVYRAKDSRLGRTVALKVLPEDFLEGEERKARFEREAKLLASLNHPGIATLYSFEEIPGPSPSSPARHVLVMELVEGKTLHAALAKGPLPVGEAIAVGVQIADALAEAHRAGILHRDVKSGNVMLTSRGQVKVLDFGLAKRLEGGPVSGEAAPELTREGTTLGTLSYMSPEQLLGKTVDVRSDLFSFGVVLYEMVTGRLPFQGSNTVAVADAILHAEPRDLGERPLPGRLKAIVGRLLEKDPAKRYASAEEVREELKRLEVALAPGVRRGVSRTARSLRPDGRFRETRLTKTLRTDAAVSMRQWCRYFTLPSTVAAWQDLVGSVRTGRSAFPRVHGRSVWDYYGDHPDEGRAFAEAMRAMTSMDAPAVAAAYPWPESGTVCDVAGGTGTMLAAAVLARRKGLRGVLVDVKDVLVEAGPFLDGRGLTERVELVECDIFASSACHGGCLPAQERSARLGRRGVPAHPEDGAVGHAARLPPDRRRAASGAEHA